MGKKKEENRRGRRPERAWLTERSRELVEQAREKLRVKSRTSQVVESALERYVEDLDD